ncbi:EAL domain-containing protein [Paraburkholderia ferrariae]|jgi:EAL domain-containing protein (putative c-di-GMP-specific phosphodiesterase class I)|uniref:EAL domain-containing protein n=1 Tax=Paraburkholderia ferrariae TaxID=386056 RepID=UPI0009FE165C|nr:EAL domain-containing protein [Paraburkholderia ferrariae]
MPAIERVNILGVPDQHGLAALLGDRVLEARSDALMPQSQDGQTALAVFAAIQEDRLFFRQESICSINAPAQTLYREALVRMKVGDVVLPPGRFIPALERLSLMRPFDCFVLRRTIDAVRAMPGMNFGCNVSAQSARDDHWWESLFLELAAEPDLAARLIVEITESAPVSPIDARAFVRRLRALGVRVAVDDFGVGFSADAVRVSAPDIIKLDRSFMRRVRQGTYTVDQLGRLVRMARYITPLLVIEGIETPDDVRVAREAGAQWIQGYYLDAADTPSPMTV